MAQERVVMAFRRRLYRRGYRQIRIQLEPEERKRKLQRYQVRAVEPLAETSVETTLTLADMARMMR